MRVIFLLLALGGAAWSQALTEGAAAVAGGAVGGAAGKKVGEGVAHVLDKVAGTAAKAADDKESKQAKAAPALEVGTGVPKVGTPTAVSSTSGSGSSTSGSSKRAVPKAPKPDRSLVPPPPPPAHQAVARVEAPSAAQAVVEEVVAPPLPPPPPPEVTAEDLRSLANGMGRLAVLKLGSPASRITMADSGHLVEIYSYAKHDKNFGVVRLSDGVVSSIEIRP
jgi:hypothetical protein